MKTERIAIKSKSTSKKIFAPAQAIAPNNTQNVSPDVQEAIRLKAHDLFLKRHSEAGDGLEDWLAAERIVLSNTSPNVTQKK